jgi:hypothetical protein
VEHRGDHAPIARRVLIYHRLRGNLPFDAHDRPMIMDNIINAELEQTGEQWTRVSLSG